MLSETRPTKVGKWTEPALRVLRERYLMREGGEVVETPEEMCWRVALSIAAGEARYGRSDAAVGEIAAAFYEMMIDGYFLPNSPTLMNAGKGNGLQYSACYVLPVGDSMEEIFDSVKAAAIIHKCLVGDTLVMSNGLTRLKDVPDGAAVMTDAGPFYVSARHDNGEQRVFEVKTNRGYKIVGTAEHRLLTVAPDGAYAWRKIGEIRSGDWLVMQPGPWTGGETKLPQFTFTQKPGGNCMSFKAREYRLPRELTPDLAELIGLYIGDGSNHRDGIRFTVGGHSPEVVRRIQELSVTLFGKAASVSKYPRENAYEVAILSTLVKQWFAFLGFTKTLSREARVPEIILRGPEAEACAFLRGLFTADGCVRANGHITLTTSSRQLGEELQIMLFALGIPTKLRADVSPTGYESYQLSVCTRGGFLRFRETIGFASKTKAKRLAAVDERAIFVTGETIPNQRARLRAWYDGLPAGPRRKAKVEFDDLLNRVTAPGELTRQRVTRAIEKFGLFPPFFKDLTAEEFFFVRVTGVRDAGVQRVYDLTVPEKHAYLANGFVSHNSGGGCISGDARVWTTFCGLEPIEVLANRATADGRTGERSGAGVAFDVSDLNISTVAMDPNTGDTGLRRVTHVWRFDVPAELQVLVETREGTQIQTSAWHPFMVMRPEGLVAVRADELASGDVILGPDRPDAYWPYTTQQGAGRLVVDESIGWLVGFTLGDGSFGYVPSLRQYRLRWFSGEPDVLDKVRAVLAGRGVNVSIQRDGRGLLSVATLTQRFVLDMLEACGLEKIGPKDERVRVPEVIAKSPLPVVRAFVAGLLDSDGYVAPDGSPSYATASREMAEDLAGLMSLLGYQPSLAVKPPRGQGKRTIYSVQLCPLPQVGDLRTDIAPYAASGHKLARLVSRSRKRTALRLRYRPWRDRLKALGLVGSPRRGVGPCSAELNRWSCNPYRRCRRDDLLVIADTVASRDAGLGRLLRRVATRGLEIAAVGRAPEPKAFYDLSVEEWNTYAAGTHGMAFVHNTGFAFSRLRPKDDIVASTGGRASGPVSFLRVFNSATEAVKQGGTRRGANMGILKVDHPDILEFIDCKLDGGITNFNISVAATDTFMDALAAGGEYDLVNPHSGAVTGRLSAKEVFDRIVRAAWRTGDPGMVFIDRINASPANPTPEIGVVEATNPCVTGDTLVAVPDGWRRADAVRPGDLILTVKGPRPVEHVEINPGTPIFRVKFADGGSLRVTAAHQFYVRRGDAELAPLRLDRCRIGDEVQTFHAGVIGAAKILSIEAAGVATTYDLYEPETDTWITDGYVSRGCGEQPLLPNEACNLGSLNVSKFARRGEGGEWTIDWDEMERVVRLGVRFLDDVIEMNPYPLPEIDATVKSNRRIGLGIMGWADLLFTMGIAYDSQEAIDLADRLMAFVKDKAHDQTAKLAEERGPFPNWSCSIYKHERPLRNSTVTTIAPTGTISMIAGCSSGIEPIFALAFEHRVKQPDGERVLTFVNETFEAIAKNQAFYSDALMREIAKRGSLHGIPGVPEGAAQVFKTSHEIGFEWHVRHQAAFQRYTDNGVSKTINLPNAATEADVARAYTLAWELGCLGITVFRDGCKGEQVLNVGVGKKEPSAALPTTGPVVIRPRPHSLTGSTYRTETPIGTAFITVNQTPDGDPFEVFVQVGKGGSDTMAVAEALGRLISLSLRLPSPLSAQRRLEEVISQLSRIGGGQPTGFGPAKILSLPDALARTLAQHIGQVKPAPEVPVAGTDGRKKIGDLCKECGQATFIYEEGCKKCLSCGFNEC